MTRQLQLRFTLVKFVLLYFCRVGLSAGTGLGVSSALVQNTGNETANQDGANNNPQVPHNNQAPVNNQAVNNANDDGNNEVNDDVVEQGAQDIHAAPAYGPVNQQQVSNPNVGEEMEVDAIENDALNDEHDKPCAVQKDLKGNEREQNNKNVGNSSEDEGSNGPKPCCSCDCHKGPKSSKLNNSSSHEKNTGSKRNEPQPGPSGSTPTSGMQLRPRSSAGVVTPKKEDSRRKDKDTGELEHDCSAPAWTKSHSKRRKSSQADHKNCEVSDSKNGLPKESGESSQDSASKISANESCKESSKDKCESPDGRSSAEKEAYASSLGLETKLRRSARLSKGSAVNGEVHVSSKTASPSPTTVPPENSNLSSSDPETTSPEPTQRKGKSWYVSDFSAFNKFLE